MKMLFGCFLFGFAVLVSAQSSQDLRNRYGEPEMERFAVQPGISLAVEYGSDHLVCQALIQPPQTLIHGEEPSQLRLMSSEAVTDILQDIAPMSERGKEVLTTTTSGCNRFQVFEYEKVTITRSTHNCLPLRPEREMGATIKFKREACRKLPGK